MRLTKSKGILSAIGYGWSPSWVLTLLAVVLITICLSLSHWQHSREQEKRHLLQAWQQAGQLPVARFPETKVIQPNQRLLLQGRYVSDRQFLLDNRTWQGQVGYDVYTPFALANGGHVLINRGWLPAPPLRTELPALPLTTALQRLQVRFYPRNSGDFFVFGQVAETEHWPIRLQTPDLPLMSRLAGLRLQTDAEMRLLAGETGALQVIPPVAGLQPEKHTAYALQWKLFAALVFVFWLLHSLKKRTTA